MRPAAAIWLLPFFLLVLVVAIGMPRADVDDRLAAPAAFDAAIEALTQGELDQADRGAERAALADLDGYRARRDFVQGCSAWRRSEAAEILAEQPEAGLPALDAAVGAAHRSAASFLAAARAEHDWPAARRNLQRALERIVYLEKRRDLMRAEARRDQPEEKPAPEPEAGMPIEEEVATRLEAGELEDAALARVLELLARKEREKLELRRRRLAERARDEEGDW